MALDKWYFRGPNLVVVPIMKRKKIHTKKAPWNTISEIVNRHNYYRNTVRGANISNLIWSSPLATSAQSWANYLGSNNLFQHSPDPRGRHTPPSSLSSATGCLEDPSRKRARPSYLNFVPDTSCGNINGNFAPDSHG